MSRFPRAAHAFALLLSFLVPARPAGAQGTGPNVDREAMWWAPTAEDWNKPCLIPWQRTWDDAVAVSKATGKAILICVNMDGEIASEHYAGVRYRQPEIAKLYEPYVCVIASVYRHSPRDYDEQGRRIPCPRFGTVTCGEHIAIEPLLYEKYFDGKRIAPRHIGVELDRSEMYDVYYAWDIDTIFNSLRDGIANRAAPPPIVRGDKPLVERVQSRDVADRAAVEQAFQESDKETQRALIEAALQHPESAPVDLLRLALFGFDLELSRKARQALAQVTSQDAIELINEALRVPMEAGERDALIAALERIGGEAPRARTLARVHRGLSGGRSVVDAQAWSRELAGSGYAPAAVLDSYEVDSRFQRQDAVLHAKDPEEHLQLAEAFLARAVEARDGGDTREERDMARLLFLDAQRTAQEAEHLGAQGWRVDAVIALAAYQNGDRDLALERAERAVRALPAGDRGWNSMAVLDLFARLRWGAILRAVRAKENWPPEWMSDIHATCSILGQHPLGTEAQVAWHHDVLQWLGAHGQAARALDQGLQRFPLAWALHERLRTRVLKEKGVDGLIDQYEGMLNVADAAPGLEWFAGYACIVASEFHRRAGRTERALDALDRAISHYEHAIAANPAERAGSDHYVALALAARARLAFEGGDLVRAVDELIAALQRRPEAAATQDGLNISPADTARALMARLKERELAEPAARLQDALDQLDPELLDLPAYERAPAGASSEGAAGTRPRSGR